MTGDRTPRPLVTGPASDALPTLSPDDRALAYSSDVSGRHEIYVRPFPGPGTDSSVTRRRDRGHVSAHGANALFSRGAVGDGGHVSTSTLAISAVRSVFDGTYLTDAGFSNYDVSPDGKHFLMLQSVDRQAETIMVYRWAEETAEGME